MNSSDIKKIEKIIHYSFKDKANLVEAFTHSSYANQHGCTSYERLEFLGDAILDFVIASELYNKSNLKEGELSKSRARLVNSSSLIKIIDNLKLSSFIRVGDSVKSLDNANSIKEDLFESIVGAIYIDSSLDKARRFITRFIDVNTSFNKVTLIDYKSLLQEKVQRIKGSNLVYFTYEDPTNNGDFCAEVYINDVFVARAFSKNKKTAQMECARLAMQDEKTLEKILG